MDTQVIVHCGGRCLFLATSVFFKIINNKYTGLRKNDLANLACLSLVVERKMNCVLLRTEQALWDTSPSQSIHQIGRAHV